MSNPHWLTKELTLDLLAIGIHTLQKVYDAVKAAPAPGAEWPAPIDTPPAVEPAPQAKTAPEAPPAPSSPAPTAPPAEAPTADGPEPEADLLPDAQTELRHIAQDGDREWITGTLFPKYGVASLTDVPTEKLPELIADARQHREEMAA